MVLWTACCTGCWGISCCGICVLVHPVSQANLKQSCVILLFLSMPFLAKLNYWIPHVHLQNPMAAAAPKNLHNGRHVTGTEHLFGSFLLCTRFFFPLYFCISYWLISKVDPQTPALILLERPARETIYLLVLALNSDYVNQQKTPVTHDSSELKTGIVQEGIRDDAWVWKYVKCKLHYIFFS